MSEFEEEGLLSRLTEDQKRAAWVPTTNDANEGALGRYRLSVRAAPRVTNEYFNSLNKHYYNNTQDFMDGVLTSFESQSHLRRVARERDAAGIDRKRQAAVIGDLMKQVEIKRIKLENRSRRKEERLKLTKEVVLIFNFDELRGLSNVRLKEQLARLALEDPDVPSYGLMNKSQLLETLSLALDRFKSRNNLI